jgi:hypothetical protein
VLLLSLGQFLPEFIDLASQLYLFQLNELGGILQISTLVDRSFGYEGVFLKYK